MENRQTKTWSATVAPQERSTVKIEGEISYAELTKYRGAALAALGKEVSIDGFRKCHIPEKVLLKRVGEMAVLTEMAERALGRIYPEILKEHNIDALGRPQISITKLAPNNPLGFSIIVAVVPEITLPDYKKIAREIRREIPQEPKKASEDTSDREATAKHRAAITDRIIEMSEIDLPQVLVDAEIGQMFGQVEQDLARANLKIDDYISHIKKTREELAREWAPAAEKRAKLQLILNEIAKKEDIHAPAERVEDEVKHLLEHYKDADETRVRLYVSSMLTNDEVLTMLEKQNEE